MATPNAVQTEGTWTVADVFLEALAEAGIDYLFTVLGSDHPSIIEAYVRRQQNGQLSPKMLLFQHEMVAISAADGYARVTRRPQCVIVHVDVGTSALGQGLHNASSGKAPVLIFAGQAPSTMYGELAGSRSEHVQWYQDAPRQADIVAPFSRYSNEIKCAEHVKTMVNRALLMATSGSAGPAYLTATREALAAAAETGSRHGYREHVPSCKLGGLPEADVTLISDALIEAKRPLIVTGYLGRSHAAVHKLVELANLVRGLRVFDFESREMSFPANHRAYLTRATGAALAIKTADVVVVLDCDVPWIPTKVRPPADARIFHVDVDPRKEKMQLFDIFAQATYNAECELVLEQLLGHINAAELSRDARVMDEQWAELGISHERGTAMLQQRRLAPPDGTISNTFLFSTIRDILPSDTVFVSDVVTNQVPFTEQMQFTEPGSHISKGGSGLGWAGGAAIGARLALDRWDTRNKPHCVRRESTERDRSEQLVCCITGDGSFIFGVPSAVYWAQHKLQTSFLSIIINNGGWKATRSCITDVHPGGLAAAVDDEGLGIDLKTDGPDYVGIAVAASNGTLHGQRVSKAAELTGAIRKAMIVVQSEKRGALLEVVVC
ncbi:hypothetical protein LTR95_004684 [Oleoguttula sp. CCFEE 5521]